MENRGFCGCCSLRKGGVFTAILASVYNGLLIYWFYTSSKGVESNNELHNLLMVLLSVLSFLAAVHIAASCLLIYALIKDKAELVVLWVIVYISSCLIVAGLLTIGLAFLMDRNFLFIPFCNVLFVPNITMTYKLYQEMVANMKKEEI